jgi:hypothetical protein
VAASAMSSEGSSTCRSSNARRSAGRLEEARRRLRRQRPRHAHVPDVRRDHGQRRRWSTKLQRGHTTGARAALRSTSTRTGR